MAPVTFRDVCTYCGLVLCLLTVFFLEKVNSSAICVEKFVDGENASTRYEYLVGERITLRCDVSARDPATHVVYWKHDSLVFSQEDHVIAAHKEKYDVSLENDIYTISWNAELDDAGKYNCTCSTGGLQFLVWIKVPCNKREHVINETASIGTSQKVLDYLDHGKIPELKEGESLNFSVALDCGCTWPEVDRNFTGIWDPDNQEPFCVLGENEKPVLPDSETRIQDNSTLATGCATKHSVTYRYKAVYGHFDLDFTCTKSKGMMGNQYAFYYIEEGQNKTELDPLMKIRCENCTDCGYCIDWTCFSATIYMCIITGSIMAILCVFMIVVAVFLKVGPDKPGPPEETKVTDILRTSAVVSWKPPTDDGGSKVTGYKLERRLTSSNDRWAVVKKLITELSYKDEGLTYEMEYEYRVAAKNMAGFGEPSYTSKTLTASDVTTDAKSPPVSPGPSAKHSKKKRTVLFAIIVYGCIIGIGVVCIIALLVQSIKDAKCLIPWSRVCPCSRCDFGLRECELICVSIVGVFIVCVMIAAIFLLVILFKRRKRRQRHPECRPPSATPVCPKQIYPSLKGMIDHENETDVEKSPRKKNTGPLRKRQLKKVAPSDDEIETQAAPSWDDEERQFPNGSLVPVSGSHPGQLSNMTPEKHPPPKLDPIITLPEGGDATVDENGESPRKRKKKKKKSRHHRSPPQDGDTDPFVAAEDTGDAKQSRKHRHERTGPGYDDGEPKSTNDTSFNPQGASDERVSERSRGLHRSEEPVPSVNLDMSNHNNYSES